MCGICGYVGEDNSVPIVYDGLSRLEYRGYDSAGIAILEDSNIVLQKSVGNLEVLGEKIAQASFKSTIGIGHTRWATHGIVNEENAHPHISFDGSLAIVHNGIIENFPTLKKDLIKEGITFHSDTDTEVIAHILAKNYKEFPNETMEFVIMQTRAQLRGTYGVLILHRDFPDTLFGLCHGSPLVIAKKDKAMLCASDASALRKYSDKVIYLEEGEIAKITKDDLSIYNKSASIITRTKKVHQLNWDISEVEKGEYDTFMEKEIHEHPVSLRNAIVGRINFEDKTAILSGMNMRVNEIHRYTSVKIISIGTSLYSSQLAALLIEDLARIPASAEMASEFVCRNPVISEDILYIVVSQSGETYDSIIAMREILNKDVKVRGVCNVVGSTISRETSGGTFTHSGMEIAVASTKAFTGQLGVLYLLALKLARSTNMSLSDGSKFIETLQTIAPKMETVLLGKDKIKEIAKKYAHYNHIMYLGRGLQYPVALEAALKLKEISYINANAYSASEMKHGPIALIDENFPVIALAPNDFLKMKMLSSIQEVKARNAPVVVITSEGCTQFDDVADDIIRVPEVIDPMFYPFLTVLTTHLFAMYIAIERSCNVDKPRNLAKSVTVE